MLKVVASTLITVACKRPRLYNYYNQVSMNSKVPYLQRAYSRLRSKIQTSEVRRGKKIKAKSVLLIDDTGNNLGKMDSTVAMKMAQAKGLDLIQVTRDEEPVCKMISRKQLWIESKNTKERNKKDPRAVTKEVQVMVGISEHDLRTKLKAIRAFLERKHSIKIWVQRKRHQRFIKGQLEQEALLDHIMENVKDLGSKTNESYNPRGLTCIVRSINQQKE